MDTPPAHRSISHASQKRSASQEPFARAPLDGRLVRFGAGRGLCPGCHFERNGGAWAAAGVLVACAGSGAWACPGVWLGGAAAILRVVPVLVSPWLGSLGLPDVIASLLRDAFGLSGPLALAALLGFTINLWPVLRGAAGVRKSASQEQAAARDQS